MGIILKVEDEGGMLEAVKQESTGSDQRKQQGPPRFRFKRKEILLGTNQYPNFNEKQAKRLL